MENNLPFSPDTWIGAPLRKAPWPLRAVKSCSKIGLYTIPISATLSISSATEMHVCGKPWTKFIVPSMGSIIHVGASVNSIFCPEAVLSSPMNLPWNVNWFWNVKISKLHLLARVSLLLMLSRQISFLFNYISIIISLSPPLSPPSCS